MTDDELKAKSQEPVTITMTRDVLMALAMIAVSFTVEQMDDGEKGDGAVTPANELVEERLLVANLVLAIRESGMHNVILKALGNNNTQVIRHVIKFHIHNLKAEVEREAKGKVKH
jgi:hypothetical protein